MGNRKSAMATMVQQAILPQIQQLEQQSTQAIMAAIANIPQSPGIDPMLLQQIEGAIAGVQQIDIMPIVQTLQNLSEQINTLSLAEERPTRWSMIVERDPETHFIKAAHIEPLYELPSMETSNTETEVFS